MLKKVLILTLLLSFAGGVSGGTPDVRILIDVSGSMRKTDPQNLRVPALRLVNGLLPLGSRAGVWLFAENNEVLAKPGEVDEDWKKQTAAKLTSIHSRGLFTDIEQAIDAASTDWDAPDPGVDRHLILLTDGLVDVSKDSAASAASRQRIVGKQLDHLKDAKVKVHTIALSDQVDKDLLRVLSTQTGGWMESAKTADALQRAFLHMLEQTATPTTTPIKDNAFEIDGQVSEFTLLAFHPDKRATTLISPSGKSYTAQQHPVTAVWREEAGYDLVTLSSPEAGKWQLKGVTDPDNRVALVTDLGIGVGTFPGAIAEGSAPEIEAWLTDHQQPVTRDDLLELVTASASATSVGAATTAHDSGPDQGGADSAATHAGAASEETGHGAGSEDPEHPRKAAEDHAEHDGHEADKSHAQDDKAHREADSQGHHEPQGDDHATKGTPGKVALEFDAKTGRFRGTLDTKSLPPGGYELHLLLDGKTFKRQAIKHFEISGPPLDVAFAQKPPNKPGDPAALILTFDGKEDLVDTASLGGYLVLTGPEKQERVVDLPRPKRLPSGLRLAIEHPGEYSVKGRVMGRSPTGESIDVKIDPKHLKFEFAVPEGSGETPVHEAKHEPVAWLEMAMYLGGGNAGLGAVLGLTLWILRRPNKTNDNAKGKAPKGKKK